jgi:hypothetical protein
MTMTITITMTDPTIQKMNIHFASEYLTIVADVDEDDGELYQGTFRFTLSEGFNIPDLHPGAQLNLNCVTDGQVWTVDFVAVAYDESPYGPSIRGQCSFRLLSKSSRPGTDVPYTVSFPFGRLMGPLLRF